MSDGAYSRIYHSVIDDERFVTIYPNDAAFSAWLRLLMAADAMYPAPAPLPRVVKPKALAVLVAAGVVELVGPEHYRIHGLASERDKRSQSGRNAAASRWQKARTADPLLDETRRDEQRQDEIHPSPSQRGSRKGGTNPRAEGTNPRANGHSPRQERAAEKQGGTEALGALIARVAAEHSS